MTFDLSKRIKDLNSEGKQIIFTNRIHLQDVKEFIRLFKEKSKRKGNIGWEGYIGVVHIEDIEEIINKLAGKDLI